MARGESLILFIAGLAAAPIAVAVAGQGSGSGGAVLAADPKAADPPASRHAAQSTGAAGRTQAGADQGTAPGAVPGTLAKAPGTICLGPISAQGFHTTNAGADWHAQTNWEKAAKAKGSQFGGWNNAVDKNISCRREGKWAPVWICLATGRPCDGPGGSSGSSGGAATCKPALSVEGGEALFQQPGAENNALFAWQSAATNQYGPAYGAWGKARNPGMSCSHNNLGLGQRRWRCTATEEPCP